MSFFSMLFGDKHNRSNCDGVGQSENDIRKNIDDNFPHTRASIMLLEEQLQKKISRWRKMTIILLIAIVIHFINRSDKTNRNFTISSNKDYIARIVVDNFITFDREKIQQLTTLRDDKKIKGVILAIDSNGSSGAGGEALLLALNEVAKHKPIVASVGSLCTSGAYLVSLAADRIYSYSTSIIGSVGALTYGYEFTELAKKLGIDMMIYKSSPSKYLMNPYEKMSAEGAREMKDFVYENYLVFLDNVLRYRSIAFKKRLMFDNKYIQDKILNGKVFLGVNALNLGLIDALGTEEDAKNWMIEQYTLPSDIVVHDFISYNEKNGNFISSLLKASYKFVGEFLSTNAMIQL